jgi:hypothetical protein
LTNAGIRSGVHDANATLTRPFTLNERLQVEAAACQVVVPQFQSL